LTERTASIMQTPLQPSSRENPSPRRRGWWWLIVAAGLLVLLLPVFLRRPSEESPDSANAAKTQGGAWVASSSLSRGGPGRIRWTVPPGQTAEKIVTRNLAQFARNRRDILHKMAGQFKVEAPADFERLFDAIESGRWDEARDLFESFKDRRQ